MIVLDILWNVILGRILVVILNPASLLKRWADKRLMADAVVALPSVISMIGTRTALFYVI